MTAKLRSLAPAAAGFGIPFLLVVYLALEAGGYDIVLRSQFGIIVWWAVLLGVAAGMLPVLRVTRAGLRALAVLGALALWSGLATLIWTESAERSMVEFSRLAALLGFFALLLLVQGRDGLRRSLGRLAGAVTLVAVVASTDRFLPDILSSGYANELPLTYPRARLAYPLEY